jgi:hypothetical protein
MRPATPVHHTSVQTEEGVNTLVNKNLEILMDYLLTILWILWVSSDIKDANLGLITVREIRKPISSHSATIAKSVLENFHDFEIAKAVKSSKKNIWSNTLKFLTEALGPLGSSLDGSLALYTFSPLSHEF